MDQQENNLIVRKIQDSDIEEIADLYSECFNKEKNIPKSINDSTIIIAEHNNIKVGMCMVTYIDLLFDKNKIAYINSVCVKKEYRGMRISKKILEYALKLAKSNGCNISMLTSNNKKEIANKLYQSLGYKLYNTNCYKKEL